MDLQGLLQAGQASRKAQEFRSAADCFRRALELEPDQAQALQGLADAYRGLKEFGRCLETWDRYLALHPEDGTVQARVGDACRRVGHRERAVIHYQAALRHDPRSRYALMGLGDLYQKERRADEALSCWERLLELDSRLINIRTMAGNLCRWKLDFERAAFHFRAALRLEPHNAHAVFGLADALRGMGRFEEAAPFWDEILELDSSNRQVLTRAGDCFCRLGQLEKAEGLYRRALDLGYDRCAQFGLARVQVRRGAFGEAVQRYEAILARNPEDPRAILLKGQALGEWRGPLEACAYLEAQQTSHPGMHEIAGALSRLRGAATQGRQASQPPF